MASASEEAGSITPELALQQLVEGNLRYAEGNASHPHQSLEQRAELLSGQHPFAVILVSILFGSLILAGREIQPSGIPKLIQGIILFTLIASEVLLRYRIRLVPAQEA